MIMVLVQHDTFQPRILGVSAGLVLAGGKPGSALEKRPDLPILSRLRHGVGAVEKEDGDLLVGLHPNVDSAMDPVGGLVPVDLTRRDRDPFLLATVPVLDGQGVSAQHDRDPMVRISMPGQCLTGRQSLPSNERGASVQENFIGHRDA
jgi:hypothetical protein